MSTTIVQSYTEKHHELLLCVLLWVHSTINNANGNNWVLFFRYSLVLSYEDLSWLHVQTQCMWLVVMIRILTVKKIQLFI